MKIFILLAIAYLFTMTAGFSLHPANKYYNKLFNFNVYLIHLVIALFIGGYGIYHSIMIDGEGALLLSPLVFLILFFLFDKFIQWKKNRHLLIVTRWDYKPEGYRWYIDGILTILLIIIPLAAPILIMTKLNYGTFFKVI